MSVTDQSPPPDSSSNGFDLTALVDAGTNAYEQIALDQLNLKRAKQGLSPISYDQAYGTQSSAPPGATPTTSATPSWFWWGLGAFAAVALLLNED